METHVEKTEKRGRAAYSVAETCTLLGISIADGYRKVKSGEIPSKRLGNRILIPVQWVDSFKEVG